MNNLTSIIDQMIAHGLPALPAGHPVLDGKIRRFGEGSKAWYALREFTLKSGRRVITGAFGVWQGENNGAVSIKIDWEGISAEEREQALQKQKEFENREAEKRLRRATFAANRARMQWEAVKSDSGAVSPYLQRKLIDAESVKVDQDGTLLVPAFQFEKDNSRLVGLQKISGDGSKRFNSGMQKAGAGLILGEIPPTPQLIMVGEGYATMESVRMATDRQWPAIVAFDVGNLMHVIRWVRRDWPEAHLLFIADDDYMIRQRYADRMKADYRLSEIPELNGIEHHLTDDEGLPVQVVAGFKKDPHGDEFIYAEVVRNRRGRSLTFRNAGIHGAKAAAIDAGNASVVWPRFKTRGENKWTDFNDLHVHESLDAITRQVQKAIDAALSPEQKKEDETPSPPNKSKAGGRKIRERGSLFWDKVNYLLENFTLIYGEDVAWDNKKRMLIRIGNLRLAYGTDEVKFWLNNGERRMIDKSSVLFDPTMKCDKETTVNLFCGFQMRPKQGNFQKIRELLFHLCDRNTEWMNWVLQWIAYPLQNPGAKMRSAIIMHGDEGSGKNLFWEVIVGKMYGEYCNVIGNKQLEGPYNEWASKKLFMVADEVVTRAELRQLKGSLRNLITGETVNINQKFMSERIEANHMNFVFLSNELQPLALDKTDRRYLVLWTPPKKEESFYEEVGEEIRNGGIEAFYHHLLHEVPLTGFNEHSKPPMNTAKSRLISLGLSPSERFYRDWSEGFLPLPFMSCTAEQLYAGFTRWCTLNGEKFFQSQQFFGRHIDRVGHDAGVRRAIIRVQVGEKDVRRQRTVYLVGDMPEGKTSREHWVKDAASAFDKELKRYRGVYESIDCEGG